MAGLSQAGHLMLVKSFMLFELKEKYKALWKRTSGGLYHRKYGFKSRLVFQMALAG